MVRCISVAIREAVQLAGQGVATTGFRVLTRPTLFTITSPSRRASWHTRRVKLLPADGADHAQMQAGGFQIDAQDFVSAVRRAAFRPLKPSPRAISGLKAALQKQNSANKKKPVSVN